MRRSHQGDKDRYLNSPGERTPAWSPDSKWLAYAKRLENYLSAVFLYSLADGKSTQLTDGLSDARYPVFDADGKYLYFAASTDVGPSLEPDIRSGAQQSSRSVYLAVLSKTDPSPFARKAMKRRASREVRPARKARNLRRARKPPRLNKRRKARRRLHPQSRPRRPGK
jgi:tricorn protease